MTDRIDFTPDYGAKENSSIIKVIGVGGGGSNAVKHMYSEGIVGVDFLVCNTDQGHLEKNPVPNKLLLGNGLGAGANPETARQFATESKEKIREFIGENTKMLFITAGMGKGTGTGASPVVAQIAKEMGILTIGVVTYPFKFEKKRSLVADKGIEELNKYVDSLIVVKNQNILTYYKDQSMQNAYGYADDVLKNAVKCIAELITKDYNQNVDFNDVQTIMKDSGKAMLGIATASGEDRINRVVDDALNCPLLDTTVISNAKNFLFFISYGPDSNFSALELGELTERFDSLQSDDADIIWGQGVDENLGDAIKLSVIISNFSSESNNKDTHTFIQDTKSNNEPQVFTTSQEVGKLVEEQPIIGKTIVFDEPEMPNDLGSLISQNAPASTVAEAPSAPVNPAPTIFDYTENGTVNHNMSTPISQVSMHKVEAQADPLYNSEEEFKLKVNVPTFYRMGENRTATMSAASHTATMEHQRVHQVANDMDEFFTDLAD